VKVKGTYLFSIVVFTAQVGTPNEPEGKKQNKNTKD
jgi:hypothetical protein